jgi:periplasmic copper chaperone A
MDSRVKARRVRALRVKTLGAVGALGLLLAATGCAAAQASSGGSAMAPTSAYVEQPSATGKATVGYLDIRNNGLADTLTSVSTSIGGTVELRGPVTEGQGPVTMHTVTSIPLPAGETTQLIPNSFHLLISGTGAMYDGKDIQLTLRFAHGNPITVNALVTNPQNGGSSYFLN